MSPPTKGVLVATVVLTLAATSPPAEAQQESQRPRVDANLIAQAAGTETTITDDGVVRIGWARDDVDVTVDHMARKPFAGLGSWAAFTATPHGAMVMGDTVVFQDEATPAIDAAFKHGLQVTALHNHFFYDEPKAYFMHIGGSGGAEKLAAGVKAVWDAIKAVRKENPQPADRFPGKVPEVGGRLNPQKIETILGHEGKTEHGVLKVSIGRQGKMHGIKIGASMGLTTWSALSGSDKYAAVDGDFIMTGPEVQPVLKTLRKHGIHIVALHNHMIGEKPAFYFTHYWGKGPASELAQAIKAALHAQQNAHHDRQEKQLPR